MWKMGARNPAAYIKDTLHIDIEVNSIFDVQAKRLHTISVKG